MINELVELVQQIESVTDDGGRNIIGVQIDTMGQGRTYVQMDANAFLTEFDSFDIGVRVSRTYPFELATEIEGVKFMALVDPAEVIDLKETMPKQWEYISQKVQVEAV